MILAARLSGKAATGQILVSQRSYAAIDGAVEAEEVAGLELKGDQPPGHGVERPRAPSRPDGAAAPDEVASRPAAG